MLFLDIEVFVSVCYVALCMEFAISFDSLIILEILLPSLFYQNLQASLSADAQYQWCAFFYMESSE